MAGRGGGALGAADEKKEPAPGTVEAWGRSADNPVGGWYGLGAGYRGRFGMYLHPLLEALGLTELTHDTRNNRIRATWGEGPDPCTRTPGHPIPTTRTDYGRWPSVGARLRGTPRRQGMVASGQRIDDGGQIGR